MSFLGKEIYMAFLENAHKQPTKRNLEHHTIKTSHLKPDIKIVCIFLKIQMNFFLYRGRCEQAQREKFLLTLAL